MLKKLLISIAFFLIFVKSSWAQPPLPPNPPPPPPPSTEIKSTTNTSLNIKPLVEIKLSISQNVLTAIADTLKKFGFEIIVHDHDELLIEAKKMDGNQSKGFDRVKIWLENKFSKPNEYILIHLKYERFVELVGKNKIIRSTLSKTNENVRIGDLKKALKSIPHQYENFMEKQ